MLVGAVEGIEVLTREVVSRILLITFQHIELFVEHEVVCCSILDELEAADYCRWHLLARLCIQLLIIRYVADVDFEPSNGLLIIDNLCYFFEVYMIAVDARVFQELSWVFGGV